MNQFIKDINRIVHTFNVQSINRIDLHINRSIVSTDFSSMITRLVTAVNAPKKIQRYNQHTQMVE